MNGRTIRISEASDRPRVAIHRLALIAVSIASIVSCSEPVAPRTPPASAEPVVKLTAYSAGMVQTVLDDGADRIDAATDDPSLRQLLRESLGRLQSSVDAGRLVAAQTAVREMQSLLRQACEKDQLGSGAADRTAIELSLGVASERIINARRDAAGEIK